ncbi:MAG: hypothetical protein ACLPTJ_18760 [Solirubrobacteraceae bacterium]
MHTFRTLERQIVWILDPVPAWLPTRNRLVRRSSPAKHHLADPALAANFSKSTPTPSSTHNPPAPPTHRRDDHHHRTRR